MGLDKTRQRLLKAATAVFVEKGVSGARVDEIAKQAKANKAMIYYHFRDKQGLYRAVLAELLGPIQGLVEDLVPRRLEPKERLREFYKGFFQKFLERPALPHLMIREILGGGRHMDRASAEALAGVLGFVQATLEEGRKAGRFRRVNPVFFHLSVVAPVLLFLISSGFRERVLAPTAPGLELPTPDDMLSHLDRMLDASLEPASQEELT